MAISEVTTGGASAFSTTVNATGGDMIVVMAIGYRTDSNTPDSAHDLVIDYAGKAGVQVAKQQTAQGSHAYIGYLVAPAAGSNTLTLSFSGGGGLSVTDCIFAYAVLSGAKKVYPIINNTSQGQAEVSSGTIQMGMNVAAPGCFIYVAANYRMILDAGSISASTNTTAIFTGTRGAGGFKHSGNPVSVGSNTMDWTVTALPTGSISGYVGMAVMPAENMSVNTVAAIPQSTSHVQRKVEVAAY